MSAQLLPHVLSMREPIDKLIFCPKSVTVLAFAGLCICLRLCADSGAGHFGTEFKRETFVAYVSIFLMFASLRFYKTPDGYRNRKVTPERNSGRLLLRSRSAPFTTQNVTI